MSQQTIKKVPLRSIYLGEIDGETEAKKIEDFEKYFFNQDDKYLKIISGEKFLITGRKGSGKTYLAKYVCRQINMKKRNYCVICDKSDLQLHLLLDIQNREFIRGELEVFWEWIILVQFGKLIIEKSPILTKIPLTRHRKLKKFLNRYYPTKSDVFEKVKYSLSSSSEVSGSVERTAGNKKIAGKFGNSVESSFEKTKYYQHFEYLRQLVIPILKDWKNITLIYDDLDSLEAGVHMDKFYIDLISGLLNCAKRLNIELYSPKKSNNNGSKVVVVLREDIISYMHDYNANLNKIVSANRVDLYWLDKDANAPYDHPLMKMVLLKIKKSIPAYERLTNKKLYELIFPKSIRQKAAAFYLIDYSFGRPRDLIRFLTIVQENNGNSMSFQSKHFTQAMKEYSNWFFDELRNEMSLHNNAEFLKQSLELVKNIRKINFTIQNAQEILDNNSHIYSEITDVYAAIESMYRMGVIGNSWTSENGRNYQSWYYRKDSDSEPDFSKNFTVHYALRKKFRI